MGFSTKLSVSKYFLALVVAFQVILYASMYLDLLVVRVVIGAVYLLFIPGMVILKLLKLERLGSFEVIVYAVGFSVVFLMLAGLIINQFGYIVGLSFPLAVLPLSLFVNTLVLLGAVVVQVMNRKRTGVFESEEVFVNRSVLPLVLLPVLSIIGAYFVNTTGNNLILMGMILAIAAIFIFSVFSKGVKSRSFYVFAVAMIALALLMHVSLISGYILPYGGDSPVELYVFRGTELNSHWNPIFMMPEDEIYGRYNAMLSITVLPTIYSNMLGLDPTWVFKLIYPLIFTLVPVGLYLLWQPYVGKKLGFIAAFLFMAQSTFFTEMLALNRQMIAELFFVLLLLVILNKKLPAASKFVTFALFSFGLIFSHYALAEIFLFLIVSAWVISALYMRRPGFNLQLSFVVFFFVAMFLWYIYVSDGVVFNSFMSFASNIGAQFGDFFNPASRGQAVLTGLGLASSPSPLNTLSRGFAYLTEFFIVLGCFALIRKKTPFRFAGDYTVFSVLAVVFLVLLTLVPGLADALSMTRFYHILLMVLAPFCAVGMWLMSQYVFRYRRELFFSLLVVAVLVPYFLFQTNFAYEATGGESWSVPLSSYRMSPIILYGYVGFIDPMSVHGATWVSTNVPYKYNIYGDNALYTSLTAYGLIYRGYVKELTATSELYGGQFAYLSYITVNYELATSNGTIPRVLNQTDVVYSNGGSEVYFVPLP
ncbi:MAG: DUF2206 domain-containing protein [Nitrososphaerota archaeon]|jgi:uncharacterized membrane protein|nr:DUF2206 domain-containing protein [Nitrososphaerota archaeon]